MRLACRLALRAAAMSNSSAAIMGSNDGPPTYPTAFNVNEQQHGNRIQDVTIWLIKSGDREICYHHLRKLLRIRRVIRLTILPDGNSS
jgi:hypothetical protein